MERGTKSLKLPVRKVRNSSVTWLLVMIMTGYPLAAVLVSFLRFESSAITIPFRVVVFGLAIFILASGLFVSMRGRPSKLLLIFLIVYMARLVYDYLISDNEFAPDALQFFMIGTLAPALAIAISIDERFNERAFNIRLSAIAVLCLLGYYFLQITGRITIDFEARAALSALNPISLGNFAATSIVIAIFLILSSRNLLSMAVGAFITALSLPILFSAGSRGPIVALAMALIWLSITNKRRAAIMIPIFAIGAQFLPVDNLALERLSGVFGQLDRSALARLELQKSAFSDFLDHPFLGKHFMDPAFGEGSWPHNFFLESAMAMGVLGLVLSVLLVLSSFRVALASVNRTNPLLVTLLIQAITAAQFSGALWGGDKLFALFAAVLAIGKCKTERT